MNWVMPSTTRLILVSANLYYMRYKDQLVPTGKLNDVGYKLMSNVDKSYRLGMELSAGYRFYLLDAVGCYHHIESEIGSWIILYLVRYL